MGAFSPVVVVASAARTTNGNSGAIAPGGLTPSSSADSVALAVDVTAVTGTTPSLALSVEYSNDGSNWFIPEPAETFTAITANKKVVKAFEMKATMYRVVWAITGTTPSFTFSVTELADSD